MTKLQRLRVATDVGGTFTDVVSLNIDADGEQVIRTAKSNTTPPDFERGVLEVLEKSGVDIPAISSMAHGTTVVINAITERKGVKTGLITTQGFRDVLEIARGNRPDFFNLRYAKPIPFVPRYLRREVAGRMSYRGEERELLDRSSLAPILEDFCREGVEAIAICLLHSYANDAHEKSVCEDVKKLWPDVSVVASHQITREWREYERSSTVVLSAYVQPIAERYLSRLEDQLAGKGFDGSFYVMQSNGGVDHVDQVKEIPITMVESGPASGMLAAARLGRQVDHPDVLALDIGGTTAKCSLIEGGEVKIVSDYWIERTKTNAGYPVMVPVVDIVEIGNGGGSIAWVDHFGKLRVGPHSAGANPGPVSYGLGGTEVTTTDANLALGRINPTYFCDGEVTADMIAVKDQIRDLGVKLDMELPDVARGIIRIANNNMINALKLVSVNRGYDPRDFTLVAFGGGGGLHAVALATELGVPKVVVPQAAAVFSAWGMIMSDLRRDYFVTRLIPITDGVVGKLRDLLKSVESRAIDQYQAEGIEQGSLSFLRFAKMRYQNQEHAVEVPLCSLIEEEDVSVLVDMFHRQYEREYTYRLDTPVQIVGVHVVVSAELEQMTITESRANGDSLKRARKGSRKVDFALDGSHETEIYDGGRLQSGMSFMGPAVIEDSGSTTLVHPNNRVEIDRYRNIHISLIST